VLVSRFAPIGISGPDAAANDLAFEHVERGYLRRVDRNVA
jgi:hypothetical protein